MISNDLKSTIEDLSKISIPEARKEVLIPLADYISNKVQQNSNVNLNFICTHNSRRSHLSQIWAQAMSYYFNIPKVFCYSGGTEATALFPKIIETLTKSGFLITKLSNESNPIYAIKVDPNANPLLGFSKTMDHPINPRDQFGAIMTCSQADEGCPFVPGAEKRFSLPFDDPKAFDHTPLQDEKYAERSIQIASEMYFVFNNVKS